ncbi:MAG: cytochrome c1 [bacterium]|nr:cytochrome c1 [bacterium]
MAGAADKAGEHHDKSHVERQNWSFSGLLGSYDKAQLKRGFTVYSEVCSACHGMNLLSWRNLMEEGGPEFTKDELKALLAEKEVPAEPNDEGLTHSDEDGSRLMRKALFTDRMLSPYANDKAAMAANGGALPPDLSVMAKARGIPHAADNSEASAWYAAPFYGLMEYAGWIGGTLKDIATQYQEGGADYIYALMTTYADEAPAGVDVGDKSFNHVFPGNAISMAAPLGTFETGADADKEANKELDAKSRDVSAFLMWASEPHLNARKNLGLKVLIYLIILSGLMYAVKRTIWAGVKH